MKDTEMNVVLSSDDNYAQHMGVCIYSLLDNNKMFDKITVHIVDNQISNENKKKLTDMVSDFKNSNINWIDFNDWKSKLNLKMEKWSISISSYARLFIGSMLDDDIDRVLYLDCDMIVANSLYDLWNVDLSGNVLAAVQDTISDETKNAVGLNSNDLYFNAGMLLIDLNFWRSNQFEEKCLDFIKEQNGNVVHHDQGVLNGVIKGNFTKLPVECNLMTIHYIIDRSSIIKYFGESSNFYQKEEIEKAKSKPIILHFTPSFTSRPWVSNCKHPLKNMYWDILNKTPWKGAKKQKCNEKWYVRLINWRYRNWEV